MFKSERRYYFLTYLNEGSNVKYCLLETGGWRQERLSNPDGLRLFSSHEKAAEAVQEYLNAHGPCPTTSFFVGSLHVNYLTEEEYHTVSIQPRAVISKDRVKL